MRGSTIDALEFGCKIRPTTSSLSQCNSSTEAQHSTATQNTFSAFTVAPPAPLTQYDAVEQPLPYPVGCQAIPAVIVRWYTTRFCPALDVTSVQAVVRSMQQFPHQKAIQMRGLQALDRLCMKNLSMTDRIVECQGIDVILATMKRHKHDASLQLLACQVLHKLCFMGSVMVRNAVVDADGLQRLGDCCKYFRHNDELYTAARRCLELLISH